jgi:hypothetical protein
MLRLYLETHVNAYTHKEFGLRAIRKCKIKRDKFHKERNVNQYRAGMACFPERCLKSDALSEIVAVWCIGSLMPSAGAQIAF